LTLIRLDAVPRNREHNVALYMDPAFQTLVAYSQANSRM